MSNHPGHVEVHGRCDEPFAAIARELRRNLAFRGDLGAAVCVTVAGETVVDLWGGWSDGARRRPWERDTLVATMGATAGVASLCAHLLIAQGHLDVDEPVATYWPRFAAAGKDGVLVRHLLEHTAGLPALRAPLARGALYDWDAIVALLEAQEPFWVPGSVTGDHGLTIGFLLGELVRRITGQAIGEFVRSHVAEPLRLDLWLGLPASEHARVSHLQPLPPAAPGQPSHHYLLRAVSDPDSVQALALLNTGGYLAPREWDSPAALSATGAGNARALAGLYAAVVADRCVGEVVLSDQQVTAMSTTVHATESDAVHLLPARRSLGFEQQAITGSGVEPAAGTILGERAFGAWGTGGSVAFGDPLARMSFAYTTNQVGAAVGVGHTAQRLIDAAYLALGHRQTAHEGWASGSEAISA